MADDYNQVVLKGNIEGTLHFGIQGPPGPQGPDGGYYVPAVEQTGENELKFSFSPSSPNMPFVDPVRVSVTTEPGSGGNVDLTGYAKEQWVQQNYQPKGDYLGADELPTAIDTALAQAKASGEFDGDKGDKGDKGDSYVLTEADKQEIASMVEAPEGTGGLPEVTTENNGAFLRVVDGAWAVATIPSAEGVKF